MSRPLGGYIGYDAEPTTTAAPGIWTLREAQFYRRKAQWPVAGFAPYDITGLQLWLDASDDQTLYDATTGGSLVAADGAVARWEDKSGNDRHATQGTAGARPLRKASVQNGLDGLRFDGSNDILSIASSTAAFKFLNNASSSVFVVCKVGSGANPNTLYVVIDNQVRGYGEGFSLLYDDRSVQNFNNAARVVCYSGSNNQVVAESSFSDKWTPNVFVLISAVGDRTSGTAANRMIVRTNGGASHGSATNTGNTQDGNSAYDLAFGGSANNSENMLGDLCEVVIYNSALGDTDREAVENYLLAKWGIS